MFTYLNYIVFLTENEELLENIFTDITKIMRADNIEINARKKQELADKG